VLLKGIAAVLPQLTATDELLVVIDHNPQLLDAVVEGFGARGSAAELQRQARLCVIPNEGEPGLSGTRNTGVAAAHGELIAFLDDDAVPNDDWLAQLLDPFSDADVMATGGVARPGWESARPGWFPEEFLWVVGCSYKGLPEQPTEIRNPIGANMAFRRSAIEHAGGFTHGIGRVGRTPLGCEETELSIRVSRATGGRIIQQPTAVVEHLVPSDRLTLHYFFHRCWAEGISKAVVARLVGNDAALASERRYATRTLPSGVLDGLRDGFAGVSDGFGRAAAIIAGLAVTTFGYVRGTLARVQPATSAADESTAARDPAATGDTAKATAAPRMPSFTPTWSGELELSSPTLPAHVGDDHGTAFERARLLIRTAGTPIGFLDLATPDGRPDTELAVEIAQSRFGEEAAAALADGTWRRDRDVLVSAVLCTRNRTASARRTIATLQALLHHRLEIIVVDNAPSDDTTFEMVRELAQLDPRIRYVQETTPGLSRARNRGLSEATGEYIAFTDDDVRVDPLWVHGLLRGFDRRDTVACVTGLVAAGSLRQPAEQYFDARVWWSSSCEQRVHTRERRQEDSQLYPYAAGAFGTGANFAARTEVLRALGGFDECLGAGSPTRGGEDLDIFVRLLLAGHALSYEPSALVWHDHRVDDASLREQMYAYGLGLTAYLTKYLIAPETRAELGRQAIRGALHTAVLMRRSRDASANAALGDTNLAMIELRGMIAGPVAYMRARREQMSDVEQLT
jgi:O-antigen biosynthesis protein